jgi:hypothetical protein
MRPSHTPYGKCAFATIASIAELGLADTRIIDIP